MLRWGNGNPLTVIPSIAGDMFPAPISGKSPRWTNARRGALNAPQLLPPIPTFPAPVQRRSRAAFLAAPRWAPVESFPPERFRLLLRWGNGNPLTVISSVVRDMFPAPVCGKSLLRTNARRGASNAPQLLPPVPTFPAPVPRRSRAAFLAAPRFRPGPEGAPPPGPPVTYGLRPFFARANQNQVEDVGPGGELSPLRGLSGAELCPNGHIPLRGIQIKAKANPGTIS